MAHSWSRSFHMTTSLLLFVSVLLSTGADAVPTSAAMSLDVPFRFATVGQRAPGDIGDMPAINRPMMSMMNPMRDNPLYRLPGVPNVTLMLDPKSQFDCSGWTTNTSRREPGEDLNSQSRHVHMGVCFPFAKLGAVTGRVVFDVLFQLHNMPLRYDQTTKTVVAPTPIVVDANVGGNIPPYMGATGFTDWVCTNPRKYTFNKTTATYWDDCKAVTRFVLDTSDNNVGTGTIPMYISARRTVANTTRFGVNLQALIKVLPGSNRGPDRSNEWSTGQQQFGPRQLIFARAEPATFPWSYQMASAMDSAVVFSSPKQPLRYGQQINLQGAVFLHDTKANMTGSYVAVNPGFHARNPTTGRPAPKLGQPQPQVMRRCLSMNQSRAFGMSPLPLGKYIAMRRSFCRVAGNIALTEPVTRVFIRGDSFLKVNEPFVMQSIANARKCKCTDPTVMVKPNDVLNGGTLSSALMFVYHVANASRRN